MALAALLAPAGCSFGGDEEPRPATGAPAEIGAVVDRLERASAEGDWATVCEDILTGAARVRAGAADCVPLLRSTAAGLARPSIEIRGIAVKGDRASVRITTGAAGQARVRDTLQMRNEGGEWRVEALAD